jgi:hypothetical protein
MNISLKSEDTAIWVSAVFAISCVVLQNSCIYVDLAVYPAMAVIAVWLIHFHLTPQSLKRSPVIATIALTLLFFLISWLNLLFAECGMNFPMVTIEGFTKIQPYYLSFSFKTDGQLACLFTNGAEGEIEIDTGRVSVIDRVNNVNCSHVVIETDEATQRIVPHGSNFKLGAKCPVGVEGNVFNLVMKIPYKQNIDGTWLNNSVTGSFRGPYQ